MAIFYKLTIHGSHTVYELIWNALHRKWDEVSQSGDSVCDFRGVQLRLWWATCCQENKLLFPFVWWMLWWKRNIDWCYVGKKCFQSYCRIAWLCLHPVLYSSIYCCVLEFPGKIFSDISGRPCIWNCFCPNLCSLSLGRIALTEITKQRHIDSIFSRAVVNSFALWKENIFWWSYTKSCNIWEIPVFWLVEIADHMILRDLV